MKSFKKISEFRLNYPNLSGRVLIVENDIERSPDNGLRDFHDLYPEVKIDDVVYTTRGVESHAKNSLEVGSHLGILVGPKKVPIGE